MTTTLDIRSITTSSPSSTGNSSNSSNSSAIDITVILAVVLPIILSPIIGGVTWVIRGQWEKHSVEKMHHIEAKRKMLLDKIKEQITKFYFPLYITILRYKARYETWEKFSAGNFSLSSKNSVDLGDQPISISNTDYNISSSKLKDTMFGFFAEEQNQFNINDFNIERMTAITEDHHSIQASSQQLDEPFPKNPSTTQRHSVTPDTDNKDIKKTLAILSEYTKLVDDYENYMVELLLDAQKIYTNNIVLSDLETDQLLRFIDLDKFITQITTFSNRKHNSEFIKSKMEFSQFPKKIYEIVEDKTMHLLKLLNILTDGEHNSILSGSIADIIKVNPNSVIHENSAFKTYRNSKKEKRSSIIDLQYVITDPQTSEPQTSEPQTSEPQTSEPQTSEPNTPHQKKAIIFKSSRKKSIDA